MYNKNYILLGGLNPGPTGVESQSVPLGYKLLINLCLSLIINLRMDTFKV